MPTASIILLVLAGCCFLASVWMDWKDRPAAVAGGIFLVIVALVYWASEHSDADRERTCQRMLGLARTHADSFAVQMRCELPAESSQVVPIVVPIPTGR